MGGEGAYYDPLTPTTTMQSTRRCIVVVGVNRLRLGGIGVRVRRQDCGFFGGSYHRQHEIRAQIRNEGVTNFQIFLHVYGMVSAGRVLTVSMPFPVVISKSSIGSRVR